MAKRAKRASRKGRKISEPNPAKMQAAITAFLRASGLSPKEKELAGTPRRVTELWLSEFLNGYRMSPAEILTGGVLEEQSSDLVIVTGLAFHSMCPHHLMPTQGLAKVAYVPDGQIVGFGRLADLVCCYTQRLILQEKATKQVAKALIEHLGALGAGCVMEARHLCLGIPEDRHAEHKVVTSSFLGALDQQKSLRKRLLEL
jgi:GTP cyclohydrolase I